MKSLLLLFVPCILFAQPPRGQPPMGPPPPMVMGQQLPPGSMGRHHMHMRHRRPYRLEMAPVRVPLTPQQQKQLLELRREFIQKRNRILNNP